MYICVYLINSDDTLTKNIPVALNPLNADDKSIAESSHQMSTTVEGLYMTSDIENKKPPPSYKPLQSTPQNVRYVMTMCIRMETLFALYQYFLLLKLYFLFCKLHNIFLESKHMWNIFILLAKPKYEFLATQIYKKCGNFCVSMYVIFYKSDHILKLPVSSLF